MYIVKQSSAVTVHYHHLLKSSCPVRLLGWETLFSKEVPKACVNVAAEVD